MPARLGTTGRRIVCCHLARHRLDVTMFHFLLVAHLCTSIWLIPVRPVDSFLIPGRTILTTRHPGSSFVTTSRRQAKAKRATFSFTNGTTVSQRFSSNKSLQNFLKNNDVFYLVDESSNATNVIVRPEYLSLVNGAHYSTVTIAEARPLTAMSDVELGQDTATTSDNDDRAIDRTQTKVVSYNDAAGNQRNVMLGSQEEYEKFLRSKNMECLVNPDGIEIYLFDRLVIGAKYTLAGSITNRRDFSAGQGPITLKKKFDYTTLLPPDQVRPIVPIGKRPDKYVCPDGFRESLLNTVNELMEQDDGGGIRVPPMALVGCSRSGKTRALEEMAATLARNETHPVAVLLVTFNDYSTSATTDADQEDPLQALCQRIVFAATRSADQRSFHSLKTAYEVFREQNYIIDPKQIVHWLAEFPAILLVDELNSLKGLTSKSSQAFEFGRFIRLNFLSDPGRYFIFTSHILGTVDSFGTVIDSPTASSRGMSVQSLPRVDNLLDILRYLNPKMDTPFEAIFYGLLPGLIYDQYKRNLLNEKMREAVMAFNELECTDKETWTVKILRSLFSGDIEMVPSQLRILLTTRPVEDHEKKVLAKISWVPYILDYVMRTITLTEGSWLVEATQDLAQLCSELPRIRGGSGKGYEYLFAIAALARCIARLPDGVLLPNRWFKDKAVVVKLNPYDPETAGKAFNDCKTWSDVQSGLDIESMQPTVAIFLPGHAFFRSYDVIAAYFERGELVDCRAFQLKEGRRNQPTPPEADAVPRRFLVKSQAPAKGRVDKNGWLVPSTATLEEFFGESGRWWTPSQWARLKATFAKTG